MATPTSHNNLLQRSGPRYLVAWSVAGALALTLALLGVVGSGEWQRYAKAGARRDATALQLRQAQQRLDALNQQKVRSADALALRAEIDALRPRAQLAQAMTQVLGQSERDRSEPFVGALVALAGVQVPGVWLTGITVADGGRKLELQGNGANGAGVLQFARRVNALLQPRALRLDSLELRPLGTAAAATPAAGSVDGVSFQLK